MRLAILAGEQGPFDRGVIAVGLHIDTGVQRIRVDAEFFGFGCGGGQQAVAGPFVLGPPEVQKHLIGYRMIAIRHVHRVFIGKGILPID